MEIVRENACIYYYRGIPGQQQRPRSSRSPAHDSTADVAWAEGSNGRTHPHILGTVPWILYQKLRIRWNAARAALHRTPTGRSPARYQQPKTGWRAVLYGAVRWSSGWFTGRRLLWLLGIVVSGSIIWLAGSHLGPGLRAAHGQGTDGLWTAQELDAGQWYGEFVSSSGTVTLPHVYYAGGLSAVQAGTTVPALDTGAVDEVYPLTGSAKWIHDVIGIAVGALALIALLARGLFVARRRRRATRADWFSYSP